MAHEQTVEIFKRAGYHWGWEGVRFRDRVTWPARGRFGDACFDMFLTHGIPPDRSKVIHGFDHLSDHRPVRHWVVLDL
jgi:hypothetical protein